MADRKFIRAARLRSQSYNEADNTIDVVWTTGAAVERMDPWSGEEFVEVLSLEPSAVRLDRLNAGAAFLDTHDSSELSKVIGSVVRGSASIRGGKGLATVKLSRASSDRDTVGKIVDGIITNISVGYIVHASRKREEDGRTIVTVTDWEPMELSAVPVPADPGAQIRSMPSRRDGGQVSDSRAAAIRRCARTAGMSDLGEEHIRRGTSASDFFNLMADRLTGRTAPLGQNAANDEADYTVGRRAAERTMNRQGIGTRKPSNHAVPDHHDLSPEQRRFETERAAGEAAFRKLVGRR